eukprot:4502403-Amphidinium_carterae.1
MSGIWFRLAMAIVATQLDWVYTAHSVKVIASEGRNPGPSDYKSDALPLSYTGCYRLRAQLLSTFSRVLTTKPTVPEAPSVLQALGPGLMEIVAQLNRPYFRMIFSVVCLGVGPS